jgi:hypothetical protein
MNPLIKGYYALGVSYIFMVLYHTIVYNEFNSISQYPAMFSNYITLSLSVLMVYLFNRRTLSVINFRRIYYVCIAYNICLYLYLNIAIWAIPNYIYSFKVSQKDLFKDPSYLTYLLSLTFLTVTIISILKKEYFKRKETLRYISVV